MTLAWIGYTLVVSALLCAAALAAERAARTLRIATRGIWMAAIVASLLLPLLISSVSIALPNIFAPSPAAGSATVPHPLVLREATSKTLSPAAWVAAAAPRIASAPASTNDFLRRAWAALTASLLLAFASSAVMLAARKRRWPQQLVAGRSVFVAPDAGPAVVGLLRPRIVLPRWMVAASPQQQALVLAHEQAHIDAHDPQLLTLALCLLVLMPWNLPLWWQLRRLRHAIEVDCDARVLRAGHDVQDYGAALIDVGARQSAFIGAVAAMAESRSLLEQRIGIMVAAPVRWRRTAATGLCGLALCALAVAAQIEPPNAASALQTARTGTYAGPRERHQIDITASRLVNYEGAYQLDEFQLVHVIREGRRLWIEQYGQERMEMYAEGPDAFFSRDIDMQMRFGRDAQGRVVSLSMDQLGATITGPLLDDAAAARAEVALKRHVQRKAAMPGGEAKLRRLLSEPVTPTMPLPGLTPVFEARLRTVLPYTYKDAAAWGKLQSLTFARVDNVGWDVYRVKHEHIDQEWHLRVDSDGRISGAYAREVF